MSNRRFWIFFVAIVLSFLGTFLPLLGAYYLSWSRAIALEETRLSEITSRLIDWVAITFKKAESDLVSLNNQKGIVPCSPEHIQFMRNMTFSSPLIAEIDYLKNGFIQECGTWGTLNPKPLKFSDEMATQNGVKISLNMYSGINPNKRMISLRRGDYHVLINPEEFSHVILTPETRVALFALNGTLIATSNNPDVNFAKSYLFDKIKPKSDKFMVSVVAPSEGFIVIAIESKRRFYETLTKQQYLLFPLSLLLSLPIIGAIIYFLRRRLSIVGELEYAIDHNELQVYYEPIIELKSGKCIGAEALIRWFPSQDEDFSPDFFMSVAEKAGLISKITEFTIHAVFNDMQSLLIANRNMHISINLSIPDLHNKEFIAFLESKLEATGIQRNQLWLEITERQLVNFENDVPPIEHIRALGYKIAVDEFGTGYSNLSYLKNIPLDVLKIDSLFIETIGINTVTSQITEHIIKIAKQLNLKTVAEGIELPDQRNYLIERKVEYGQGNLFSEPLNREKFLAYYYESNKTEAINKFGV